MAPCVLTPVRSARWPLRPPGSDTPPRPGARQSRPGGTHPGSGRACGPGRCPLCSDASAGRWRAGPRSRHIWAGWCRGRCPWGESRQRLSGGWKAPGLRLLPAAGGRMLKTAWLIKACGPVSQRGRIPAGGDRGDKHHPCPEMGCHRASSCPACRGTALLEMGALHKVH